MLATSAPIAAISAHKTPVIAFVQLKGGVGAGTLTCNVAPALAARGRRGR